RLRDEPAGVHAGRRYSGRQPARAGGSQRAGTAHRRPRRQAEGRAFWGPRPRHNPPRGQLPALRALRPPRPGPPPRTTPQGAGDVNPDPRGRMELARKHGKALADEVGRVLDGKLRPVRGPLRTTFARADLPLQASLSRKELEQLAADKRTAWSGGAKEMLSAL